MSFVVAQFAQAARVRLAGYQAGQQVAKQSLLLLAERGEQPGLGAVAVGDHLALDVAARLVLREQRGQSRKVLACGRLRGLGGSGWPTPVVTLSKAVGLLPAGPSALPSPVRNGQGRSNVSERCMAY
jgi:hypothetical protein